MPAEPSTPLPDPRPALRPTGAGHVLTGYRCAECRHVVATPVMWCPVCRGPVTIEDLGPGATVWSSTVVRIAIGDRRPPYTLAYVDIDDGPRVLAHVDCDPSRPVAAGTRVCLIGRSASGDPLVAEVPDAGHDGRQAV